MKMQIKYNLYLTGAYNVRAKERKTKVKMAEKKEVDPEEAQKAAKDAATVAQAAYNVGIDTKHPDFITIIKDLFQDDEEDRAL